MAQLFLVTAGNIIDGYNENNECNDNVMEIFDNLPAAEKFGSLYDFHSVDVKELRTAGWPPIGFALPK